MQKLYLVFDIEEEGNRSYKTAYSWSSFSFIVLSVLFSAFGFVALSMREVGCTAP